MKNLLNNLNSEEKRTILEQYKGGMNLEIKNFQKLLINKLGNSLPLTEGVQVDLTTNQGEVKEQGNTPTLNQNSNSIINKVATEGLKNVTSEMISSPQFKGKYSGYVFGGVFNNVDYSWDCHNVEGMSGVRGEINGEIITETFENMVGTIGKEITDGKPGSPCIGFYSSGSKFIIYTTSSNKPKCVYF
jgi:hypothetical protein